MGDMVRSLIGHVILSHLLGDVVGVARISHAISVDLIEVLRVLLHLLLRDVFLSELIEILDILAVEGLFLFFFVRSVVGSRVGFPSVL